MTAIPAARGIAIEIRGAVLRGDLTLPGGPAGLVVFAHGSGSSRRSPRNQMVAAALARGGFATLLFDLLTEDEEVIDQRTAEYRFDIELLGARLTAVTDWLADNPDLHSLSLGYFGASTGAAAALIAAAARPERVRAVVSRGGRPDLASAVLAGVRAPTLLIVGADDAPVIEMNREALALLSCEKHLEIVPGASHLFEEPGALESVTDLALDWYTRHLRAE